jgi:hypothetical protein
MFTRFYPQHGCFSWFNSNSPGGCSSRYFKTVFFRLPPNPYLLPMCNIQCIFYRWPGQDSCSYVLPWLWTLYAINYHDLVTSDITRPSLNICTWKSVVKRRNCCSKLWKFHIMKEVEERKPVPYFSLHWNHFSVTGSKQQDVQSGNFIFRFLIGKHLLNTQSQRALFLFVQQSKQTET